MSLRAFALTATLLASSSLFAQFTPGPLLPKPAEVVIDVNGDGLDDLLSFDWQTTVHTLHFNLGGSQYGPEIVLDDFLPGERIFSAGDMNGDGAGDLVVASPWTDDSFRDQLRVLHGDGRGDFVPVQKIARVEAILMSADVNGDRRPDLVGTWDDWFRHPALTYVTPYITQADGTLRAASVLATEWPVRWVTAGDYNGDGMHDLVLAAADGVHIAFGASGGEYQTPVHRYGDYMTRELVSADFDQDGHLDVAFHEILPDFMHTVTVLFGDGAGAFDRSSRFELGRGESRWDARPEAKQLLAGNFAGDARPEIVATRHDGPVHQLRVRDGRLEEYARQYIEPWQAVLPATIRQGAVDLFVEWQRGADRAAGIWYRAE